LTSAIDGGELSASRPGCFTPRERAPGTHSIGGWVGPQSRSGRGGEEKNSQLLSEIEPAIIQPVAQCYTTELSRLLFIFNYIMGWTIGVLGFDSRRGLEIFLFTTASRTALGPTQPPIQWVSGALSLGVKRSGHEADHSPPSSAEVKNSWSYTSTPQYVFMAWCLLKHRDNFTFT
jgi:hypothetical protein